MKNSVKTLRKICAFILVFIMVLPLAAPVGQAFATAGLSQTPVAGQAASDTSNRLQFMGRQLFKGQIHSHTSVSDGQLLPYDAFQNVLDRSYPRLDFYAVSDHAESFDIVTGEDFLQRVEDSRSQDWIRSHRAADSFTVDGEFVALIGYEITWYDRVSGHLNVLNTPWRIAAHRSRSNSMFKHGDIKYDLATVYDRVAQDPDAIVMFNHPNPGGWGVFDNWRHFNADTAAVISLFELNGSNVGHFMNALDAGWRISPVWSADEHDTRWGESDGRTGIFAYQLTRESLYQAMHERATYSTLSRSMQMTFAAQAGGVDYLLGSTLPSNTTSVRLMATFRDSEEVIEFVEIRTNGGTVVRRWEVNDHTFDVDYTVAAADGDYFFVYAVNTSRSDTISAPVWIGPVTRGTNFAPDITISNEETFSAGMLTFGQVVTIPEATAFDREDNMSRPVSYQVFNSNGVVTTTNRTFTVSTYDDYFVRFRAIDSHGNIRVRLIRLEVDQSNMNPNTIFSQFAPVANVGETAEEAGVNIVTDWVLREAILEYTLVTDVNWSNAQTVVSTSMPFQLGIDTGDIPSNSPPLTNVEANKLLSGHAFNLTGLTPGAEYMYRFAVTQTGPRTTAVHRFRTPQSSGADTIYILGDVRIPAGAPAGEYQLFNNMLETLRGIDDSGSVVVQLGDFITRTYRHDHWQRMFERNLRDLGLLLAPVSGDHEDFHCLNQGSHWDSPYNPTSTFGAMYNTPANGSAVGSTNYSFSVGEMHIAVLNTSLPLSSQLQWLREDMRATDKPWRIVMGHYSFFGGQHSNDPGIGDMREEVAAVLQQLGVHLYIGGHDRVYKRTTIADQVPVNNPNHGTTFIVAGSAGSGFYNNVVHSWDQVVFDQNIQTGILLSATAENLTLRSYTISGDPVDTFTLTAGNLPYGVLEPTGADIIGNHVTGAGIRSTPGANIPESVTLRVTKYDADRENILDSRSVEVILNLRGNDQFYSFAAPMEFTLSHTLILEVLDSTTGAPILPYILLRQGLNGDGTEADPFRLYTWSDLEVIDQKPAAHFILMNDLDLGGAFRNQLSSRVVFTGVFDGQGHIISNYTSMQGGLFRSNEGVIRNLGMANAQIISPQIGAGIIADFNTGLITQVFTSGYVAGAARVGGIVGVNESNGVIRDSYSTADVRSTVNRNVGGIVGHSQQRSMIERTYAMGRVVVDASYADNRRHAGGIVGYLHPTNTIRNNVAMNTFVEASTSGGHPIAGFTIRWERAVMYGNLAYDGMVTGAIITGANRDPNWMGIPVTRAQLREQATFENIGWDFENVWLWDYLMMRPILRHTSEESIAPERPNLPMNADAYFEISQPIHLNEVVEFPDENFILMSDLDLTDFSLTAPINFRGSFDGNGHLLRNFTSTAIGGLFATNSGVIRDLGIPNATVATSATTSVGVGILVNTNTGIISRVFTSGSVTGGARVGGIAGVHQGVGLIEDSYSLANVHAQNQRNNGGIVGHAQDYSRIERTYATGNVTVNAPNADNNRHSGGIVGYLFATNTVRDSFALNRRVEANTSAGHPIVGFVISWGSADLVNNFAYAGMVSGVHTTDPRTDPNWHGIPRTLEQTQMQATFQNSAAQGGLGWDFENVWQWDAVMLRPVLQGATEDSAEPVSNLPRNANGYLEISQAAHLNEMVQFPDESFVLMSDLDLDGFSLAGPIIFAGSFDGNGHILHNFTSTTGGLFATNAASGEIRDLGIMGANINSVANGVGIIADFNYGTIRRVFTTGSVTGGQRVGGIAGWHRQQGLIEDSYSTANVRATLERNVGGIIGQGQHTAVIARTYAMGSVIVNNAPGASDNVHAGGIAGVVAGNGIAWNVGDSPAMFGNTIRDSFALNRHVEAAFSGGHPVVGFTTSWARAILENNFAYDGMYTFVNNPNVARRDPNWFGIPKTLEQTLQPSTFYNPVSDGGLGWDFNTVWKWSAELVRPVLRSATEIGIQQPNLPQNSNGYFEIRMPQDLNEMVTFPNENFILMNNLYMEGFTLTGSIFFTGSFDGNGHLLHNFTSDTGGLFTTNSGEIRDLGIVDAVINVPPGPNPGTTGMGVGIIANNNSGTIRRVFTTGSVTGSARVGGIAGFHTGSGLIEDSYSTANIHATTWRNNGGIVGHMLNTASIVRTYALGNVIVDATDTNENRHSGGIVGVVATVNNTVRDSFALNQVVRANTSAGHAVVGFATGWNHANLINNFAYYGMDVGVELSVANNANFDPRWLGITKSLGQARMQETFENAPEDGGLGWDFETVWMWDAAMMRPVLRGATEPTILVPPEVFTVTFDPAGGTLVSGELSQVVEYGNDAVPPIVERTGYIFEGWDGLYTNITSDRILTAGWIQLPLETFAVTFEPAGGTLVSGELSQVVEYGNDAVPPIVERTGYVFEGWDGLYTNITSDRTLTAGWIQLPPEVFAVTFDLAGGTLVSGELSQVVEYGNDAVPPTVERTGYIFDGWDGLYTNITSDRVLTAGWIQLPPEVFAVTFDPAGGTLVSGELSQVVEYGNDAVPPIVERTGYIFDGWDGLYTNITSDMVIIAEWSAVIPTATVPEAPASESVVIVAGNGQLTVSWQPPASDGGAPIGHYQVSIDGETWTDVLTGRTHTFTNLTNGVMYTIRIRAVNSAGFGEAVAVTATPVAPPPPPPAPPAGDGGVWVPPPPASAPPAPPALEIGEEEVPLAEIPGFGPFIEGFPDDTFRGANRITREEFVTILFRIHNPEEQPEADVETQSFTDVPPSRWSFDAIEWALAAEIIDEGTTFIPRAELTRAEMAVMLVRAEGWTEVAEDVFSDIEGHGSAEYILKAVYEGIFEGFPDGTFRPDATATRFEMVTALARYVTLQTLGEPVTDGMIEGLGFSLTDVPHTHWAFRYVVLATTGFITVTTE